MSPHQAPPHVEDGRAVSQIVTPHGVCAYDANHFELGVALFCAAMEEWSQQ